MEILFKNITKYTDEEMKRFQEFHKKKNKNKYMFWKISLIALAIVFSIFNVIYKNWYAIVGTIILLGLIWIYYNYLNPNKKKENNKKQLGQEFTFEFTNNYMEIKAINVSNKIPYRKFHRAYETENNFYLYIDDEYSVLINKKGFKIGDVEEFRKFIKKKLIFKYRLQK